MPNLQGKIELIKQAQVDIKNAIIDKGVTPTGNISTYADAIDNIVTPNNQTKTVTENGVVRYDAGYTGLEQVTVNVNQSVQNKNITTNGTYTADSGYVGLGVVTVDVSPDVTTKTITANGTYNAEDDDVEGYSSVTVNVPSPIDDLIDGSITSIDTAVTSIKSGAFKDCEDLDTVVLRSNTVVDLSDESIFENTPIASGEGNIYVPDGLLNDYNANYSNYDINSFVQATYNTNLGSNNWTSLAYDGTKFVALSTTGYISTSTNGTTWTQAIQKAELGDNYWASLVYNGTKFVALGRTGYISTSTNGTDWQTATRNATLGSTAKNYTWNTLAYNGTNFVAMGISVRVQPYGSIVSTSVDGTNWTTVSVKSGLNSKSFENLVYDGTKFVALDGYGYISTSTDGTNWTTPILDTNLDSYNWTSLAYDGTKFVALSTTGYISTSTNGTTWTQAIQKAELGDNYWASLAPDYTKFAVLGAGGYVSYSLPKYNFISIS